MHPHTLYIPLIYFCAKQGHDHCWLTSFQGVPFITIRTSSSPILYINLVIEEARILSSLLVISFSGLFDMVSSRNQFLLYTLNQILLRREPDSLNDISKFLLEKAFGIKLVQFIFSLIHHIEFDLV